MFRNMKISVKVLLLVLVIALGTLLTITAISYSQMLNITDTFQNANKDLGLTSSDRSKEALLTQADSYLQKLAVSKAETTNETFLGISRDVTQMALYMESLYRERDNFAGRPLPLPDQTEMGVASSKYMLAPGVAVTPELESELLLISNAEYAFAPELSENDLLDNAYLGTESGISYRFSRSNAYNPDYDPRARGWYGAAMETPDRAVWMETYKDSYGTVCITCAQAFHDADGTPVGVVAMDITLSKVFEGVTNVSIGSSGVAFLLDNNMIVIAHPKYGTEDFHDDIMEGASGANLKALETIRDNTNGVVELELDGVSSYVTFATLPETGWKLCISIEIGEIVAPADLAKAEIDRMTDETQSYIRSTLSNIIKVYIIYFAVIGIIVILVAFVVSNSITRPIMALARTAKAVGGGDLDVKAEVQGGDEVGQLAATFNQMTDSLKDYIKNLTAVTAEKERIGAELNVATTIQSSMLPSIFPPFPERPEFDIFASMDPAKEVGGDFYDFFLVDDDHLALVIADVSGKGVPAALFMVIAKTLIKNGAQAGLSPAEVFASVNAQLCENNQAEMFVTAWMGIMEISTGHMVCVSAGHEYPTVRHGDGKYQLLKDRHGFVLAGMEMSRYKEYELDLGPEDGLFVYTDGVPEATDAEQRMFGTDLMLEALNADAEAAPSELIASVREAIDGFVGDAPQFDDITMLAIRRKQ